MPILRRSSFFLHTRGAGRCRKLGHSQFNKPTFWSRNVKRQGERTGNNYEQFNETSTSPFLHPVMHQSDLTISLLRSHVPGAPRGNHCHTVPLSCSCFAKPALSLKRLARPNRPSRPKEARHVRNPSDPKNVQKAYAFPPPTLLRGSLASS